MSNRTRRSHSSRCQPTALSRQAGSRPQCCSWHFRLPEFQLQSCYCIVSACAPMPLPCLRSRQNSRSRQALPPRLLRPHFRKLAASYLSRIPATTSLMPPCQAYRSFLSRSMDLCRLIQMNSPSQAPNRQRTIHLHIRLKFLQVRREPLQPVCPIAGIRDVVRNRFRCAQGDANVGRIAVALVITDVCVIRVIRRPIIGSGDRLLKIGIRKCDDVPGPSPQCREIQSTLEICLLPCVPVRLYRQQKCPCSKKVE